MSNTQTTEQTAPAPGQKAHVLSQNPGKAMREVMDAIDALQGIYVDETEALTNADTETFLSLQDRKLTAAHNYQSSIQQMLERKDEMREADPALINTLQGMQKDFSELAKKNAEALQRMNRCMERLGNTIRRAAKEAAQKQRTFSYDSTGAINKTEGKGVSTGISETA